MSASVAAYRVLHANGSDDQPGVEALSARSSSSFPEVTWRLQEGYAVGLLQPPDTVVLSCLFQYGYLVVFTAFSGPMGAALPVRERTRLISLARHHHSLAALNIAIMFSGARSAKIL